MIYTVIFLKKMNDPKENFDKLIIREMIKRIDSKDYKD
jgi:hypothetical protein